MRFETRKVLMRWEKLQNFCHVDEKCSVQSNQLDEVGERALAGAWLLGRSQRRAEWRVHSQGRSGESIDS